MLELTRMWINQPSTLQPLHELHGTNVLVNVDLSPYPQVWFLDGPVISMKCDRNALELGWLD